jgi:hypothetical protein
VRPSHIDATFYSPNLCSNEKGHGRARCPQAAAEGGESGAVATENDAVGKPGGGWEVAAPVEGTAQADWEHPGTASWDAGQAPVPTPGAAPATASGW